MKWSLARAIRSDKFLAIVMAVSFTGCGGSISSSIPPTRQTPSNSIPNAASSDRHVHFVNQVAPPDGPNPCLQNPISCGAGGCDASSPSCGGLAFPPPSGFGGGGGGGEVIPAPAQPSKRPKSAAELACNAAGGVFYTEPSGKTNCQKPTDSFATIYAVFGCIGYSVTLNARGAGGSVGFPAPQNLLFSSPAFGPGGGASFNADCSFNVYLGSQN